MPRKNNNRDFKSVDACVYCGQYVPPTNRTLRQKVTKSKIPLPKSVQQILKARMRKLKKLAEAPKPYRIRRHRFPKRKPKKQVQPPTKAGNEGRAEAPFGQPWPRDAPVMTSQMGATPVEDGLFSPMVKGLFIGLGLCTAGLLPSVTADQYRELLQTMKTDEGQAQGSNNAFLASENSSHEAQHVSGTSAVIECSSQSCEFPLDLSDQPDSSQIINMTSIDTQTDSQWFQSSSQSSLDGISNSTINLIKEPDSSHLGNTPGPISMQEDDPMPKPDEDDPVRKSEICLDEKESRQGQIREEHNIGDCQPQSHHNQ